MFITYLHINPQNQLKNEWDEELAGRQSSTKVCEAVMRKFWAIDYRSVVFVLLTEPEVKNINCFSVIINSGDYQREKRNPQFKLL